MSWRQLILNHQSDFLKWVETTNTQITSLVRISVCLESYLISKLQSPEDCIQFWNAIPMIRSACNFNETYELPFAAESYAYVHMLDRYWRTWDALTELTTKGALPVGIEGVRILDVGTGPAPTPYAIQDFYEQLRDYGHINNIPELMTQSTHFGIAESSNSMRQLIHWFSEHCRRPGPYGADIVDFSEVNPRSERKILEQSLRKKGYYGDTLDDYYYEYSPEEANIIANKHQRYRMVVFSNFFTVDHVVDQFEESLTALLADLSNGAVVLILGAAGNQYEKVYERLTTLAQNNGLQKLTELNSHLGKSLQVAKSQVEIKKCQHSVFQHLLRIVGKENLPEKLDISNFYYAKHAKQMGLELPSRIQWPDYWNPTPFRDKRTGFSFHVFRKGIWLR